MNTKWVQNVPPDHKKCYILRVACPSNCENHWYVVVTAVEWLKPNTISSQHFDFVQGFVLYLIMLQKHWMHCVVRLGLHIPVHLILRRPYLLWKYKSAGNQLRKPRSRHLRRMNYFGHCLSYNPATASNWRVYKRRFRTSH